MHVYPEMQVRDGVEKYILIVQVTLGHELNIPISQVPLALCLVCAEWVWKKEDIHSHHSLLSAFTSQGGPCSFQYHCLKNQPGWF